MDDYNNQNQQGFYDSGYGQPNYDYGAQQQGYGEYGFDPNYGQAQGYGQSPTIMTPQYYTETKPNTDGTYSNFEDEPPLLEGIIYNINIRILKHFLYYIYIL